MVGILLALIKYYPFPSSFCLSSLSVQFPCVRGALPHHFKYFIYGKYSQDGRRNVCSPADIGSYMADYENVMEKPPLGHGFNVNESPLEGENYDCANASKRR